MIKGRVKKQPQRTCIACQCTQGKRALIRIVRLASGEVAVDVTGKLPGRGAYLCPNQRCWTMALERQRVEHALKVTLTAESRAKLAAHAAQLPATDDDGAEDS
jgi:hypothetical protein